MTDLEHVEKLIRAEIDWIDKQIEELSWKRSGLSIAFDKVSTVKKQEKK